MELGRLVPILNCALQGRGSSNLGQQRGGLGGASPGGSTFGKLEEEQRRPGGWRGASRAEYEMGSKDTRANLAEPSKLLRGPWLLC